MQFRRSTKCSGQWSHKLMLDEHWIEVGTFTIRHSGECVEALLYLADTRRVMTYTGFFKLAIAQASMKLHWQKHKSRV